MARQSAVSKTRRADIRRPVHIHAQLVGHNHRCSATILDYSTNGLRLIDTFAVGIGERVTIDLLTGHRLPVVVTSVVGSQVGVRFLGPIAPGHPTLLALDAAAKEYKRVHLATEGS
jgi:PilZ domain